jgi:hypothetical protein
MKYEIYKTLSKQLKEEYDYKFKNKPCFLINNYLYFFYIFVLLNCMYMLTAGIIILGNPESIEKITIDINSSIQHLINIQFKYFQIIGIIFFIFFIFDIFRFIKFYYQYNKWKKQNNIK